MGRPTKYKEVFKDQAYKLSLLGLTDVQMAEVFGVTERTFNYWKEEKEGFFQSLKEGKHLADAEVAISMYQRAKGYDKANTKEVVQNGEVIQLQDVRHYPSDPTSAIFWLKNRQPRVWRDKQEVEHSAGKEIHEATKGFLDKISGDE